MLDWLKNNSTVTIVVIVCATVLIGLAMYFGLDLSWIPGLLGGVIGS